MLNTIDIKNKSNTQMQKTRKWVKISLANNKKKVNYT